MAEIEITTSGELKLAGETVGHIQWTRPYIESDVAGEYFGWDPHVDEWGARIDCTACGERDELISDLEFSIKRKIAPMLEGIRKEALSDDGVLISSLDALDEEIDELGFEV